jgi:hypothetical protein
MSSTRSLSGITNEDQTLYFSPLKPWLGTCRAPPKSTCQGRYTNHQAHRHHACGFDRKSPASKPARHPVKQSLHRIEDPTSAITFWSSNHSHLDIPRICQHHGNGNFDMSRGVSWMRSFATRPLKPPWADAYGRARPDLLQYKCLEELSHLQRP